MARKIAWSFVISTLRIASSISSSNFVTANLYTSRPRICMNCCSWLIMSAQIGCRLPGMHFMTSPPEPSAWSVE